jgi:hypothetical protein
MAQSGHENGADPCLLSGVKRTSAKTFSMSAFDPKQALTDLFSSTMSSDGAAFCKLMIRWIFDASRV